MTVEILDLYLYNLENNTQNIEDYNDETNI